eukprot:3842672-Alexandrium_andersonii.AAC.1
MKPRAPTSRTRLRSGGWPPAPSTPTEASAREGRRPPPPSGFLPTVGRHPLEGLPAPPLVGAPVARLAEWSRSATPPLG